MKQYPQVSERPAGKIPTTSVTNELARAVIAMSPQMPQGQHAGRVGLRSRMVTVTGNATKPGLYVGYKRLDAVDQVDPDSTTTFDDDDVNTFGEVPDDTAEIYIANGAERARNTHALTQAGADRSIDHVAYFLCYATDGKEVWGINGWTAGPC